MSRHSGLIELVIGVAIVLLSFVLFWSKADKWSDQLPEHTKKARQAAEPSP